MLSEAARTGMPTTIPRTESRTTYLICGTRPSVGTRAALKKPVLTTFAILCATLPYILAWSATLGVRYWWSVLAPTKVVSVAVKFGELKIEGPWSARVQTP
jgi:hypothetical protein